MAVASDAALLRAPFPYFGGKSRIAAEVWRRFGDVPNYVEPFFGSGAVLLARPHDYTRRTETVNDIDGLLCNFWRAVQHDPDGVAEYANWPVNECDLHARHIWLVSRKEEIASRLMGDPEWYDVKAAGWWVWGMSLCIGAGWCEGNGPWTSVDGRFVKLTGSRSHGVQRKRPHVTDAGCGVHRIPPDDGGADLCVRSLNFLRTWMRQLQSRLRRVRVICGDWARVCTRATTIDHWSQCGVFLDPPYLTADRAPGVYAHDSSTVAYSVYRWAVEHGNDPRYRIALCGYEGHYEMPDDWEKVEWSANGGMANLRKNGMNHNKYRERIWFSPHCLKPEGSYGRLI